MTLGVAVREVLIAHDPLAVLGEQRVDESLRQQPRAPSRIEETLLPIRHREHRHLPETQKATNSREKLRSGRTERPNKQQTFSAVYRSRRHPHR